MRKTVFAYLLYCIGCIACNDNLEPKETSSIPVVFILNKASTHYLSQKKVYLVTSKSRIVIDSIIINGSTNQFHVNPKKQELSSTYHMFLIDTGYHPVTKQKIFFKRPLGYWNPFNHHFSFIDFYIESGMKPIYMNIAAIDTKQGKKQLPDEFRYNPIAQNSISPQNDVLHKNIQLSSDENHNPTGSSKNLKRNTALIRKYPFSYALFNQILQTKEHFTSEELSIMCGLFNKKVQQTNAYKIVTAFAENRQFHDQLFPANIPLLNTQGVLTELGTGVNPYQLIVFWAWWCKPCREEIPALKKLYEQKKKEGLQIYHISIDGDQEKWREALKQEQMPWQQFIVNQQSYNQLMAMYDIKAIPKSYLFDSSFRLLYSCNGFDSSSFMKLTNYIK